MSTPANDSSVKSPLFHVGQAVVCIDTTPFGTWRPDRPSKGLIYMVSALEVLQGCQCIQLKEFPNIGKSERWWWASCFAPVEEMPVEMLVELLEALEPVTT